VLSEVVTPVLEAGTVWTCSVEAPALRRESRQKHPNSSLPTLLKKLTGCRSRAAPQAKISEALAQNGLELLRQDLTAKRRGGDQSAGNEIHVEFADNGNRPALRRGLIKFRFIARIVSKYFYMFRDR
jgi:hypothetical protein